MRPGGPYIIEVSFVGYAKKTLSEIYISLDALDQISVNITPYDVRQSNFIGASVNAVTRSGINEFSGSVYSYMNNKTFKGNKVGDATFTKTPGKILRISVSHSQIPPDMSRLSRLSNSASSLFIYRMK
jgi:hypothetical protein